MTCIVGLACEGMVTIGGDSAGVGGLDLRVRADRKVFRNGDAVFGFTSSFRMGQLLEHALVMPKHYPDTMLSKFMATTVVDAVRACLKTGGYATVLNGVDAGGSFLVGLEGRLFTIEGDFQVGESVHPFAAVGCGEHYALGVMLVNQHLGPTERVLQALGAAAEFSAGVRGPFHIEQA
jgi:ATP-dependent protease HslVU (ClpYQ) peptidase subunit